LTALCTGAPGASEVSAAIEVVNRNLPHYKQIRDFRVLSEPFRIENGMLTANGKLRRDAIAARFVAEIAEMYQRKTA
jgi:long-subunit acyl-CoA synthetase (AMP-forming)